MLASSPQCGAEPELEAMNQKKEPDTFHITRWAVGLYAVWILATYLLEGRILTLLRPEAVGARLTYAVVANILVGVIGAGLVLRAAVRRTSLGPARFGLRSPGRTAFSVALGLTVGFVAFVLQQPVTLAPTVIGNAFAQVWVVSVAEVLVCWVVLGKAVETSMIAAQSRLSPILAAWIVSAVAFGAYHFAHSAPFNTVPMVGFLSVVGLVTGAFFFGIGELYGTILFHNFLALKGVTDTLAEGGRLEHFGTLQLPLIATALIVTGALVAVDYMVRRQSDSSATFSA